MAAAAMGRTTGPPRLRRPLAAARPYDVLLALLVQQKQGAGAREPGAAAAGGGSCSLRSPGAAPKTPKPLH